MVIRSCYATAWNTPSPPTIPSFSVKVKILAEAYPDALFPFPFSISNLLKNPLIYLFGMLTVYYLSFPAKQ